MNKCLNCGKEVKNKFCSVSCQNEYKGKLAKLEYEKSPKRCKNCNKILSWEQRNNKYCSKSCAVSKNNKGVNRRNSLEKRKYKIDLISDFDFIKIINDSHNWKELCKALGYSSLSNNLKDKIITRCKQLDLNLQFIEKTLVKNCKKGDLFNNNKNWQSARSSIRRDAEKTLRKINKDCKCLLCGYNKHVEVAHIKSVSSFDDDALISEINDPSNLIYLCPNHHWEFDNNQLSEENLNKIKFDYTTRYY